MTASPALLTKEFELAMAKLRSIVVDRGSNHTWLILPEAAALLQHIAALEQRVVAEQRQKLIERAKFESAIQHLLAITGMLHPDSIHLPDGRVMQFAPPPESVLQYWIGLSNAIKEARRYVDALPKEPT